jgi:YceI-like domain
MKSMIALALVVFSSAVLADGKITVNVAVTGFSYKAETEKAKGTLFKEGESFRTDKIAVMVDSLKTGLDLRDEHTHKYLNPYLDDPKNAALKDNPKIILTDLVASGGKGTANLEVNGVKKPITITYKVEGTNVHANFATKASTFGLPKKEYLGAGVKDDLTVDIVYPFRTK